MPSKFSVHKTVLGAKLDERNGRQCIVSTCTDPDLCT